VDGNTYRSFISRGPSQIIEYVDMFKSNNPLIDSWEVPDFKTYQELGEEKKPIADFMGGFGIGPAVSFKAMDILRNLLEKDVELLPIKTEVGPYFALHVKLLDCLDRGQSKVRLARDGSIIDVDIYALYWEILKNVNIFRINEIGLSMLFVSDAFKNKCDENNLKGLIFYPVTIEE